MRRLVCPWEHSYSGRGLTDLSSCVVCAVSKRKKRTSMAHVSAECPRRSSRRIRRSSVSAVAAMAVEAATKKKKRGRGWCDWRVPIWLGDPGGSGGLTTRIHWIGRFGIMHFCLCLCFSFLLYQIHSSGQSDTLQSLNGSWNSLISRQIMTFNC